MSDIRSFHDLIVWQKAMALAEASYRLTGAYPRQEIYGMVAQIRRAAVSVPANIAEGYGRESTGAFIQFLRIAQGSLKELETHILLSERLKLTANERTMVVRTECEEVGRLLRALIRSLQTKEGGSE